MKVWTLITRETLQLLQEGIPYYGDKKICPVVDFPYTPGGYSLLVNKMIQTIGFPPDHSAAPIWGYYLYGGENNIPENLDFDNFPEEASVCLTLEVPDRKLLLSDSLMWDSISLGEYIPHGDTPEELDSDYEAYRNADAAKQAFMRVLSWHQVFNIIHSDYVYVHFWEIRKEMIREVLFL